MSDGKFPTQAVKSESDAAQPDGVNSSAGKQGAGESGGGAYPNPHTGKKGRDLSHGGQSENAYYGPGQLGDKKVGDNPNAVTKG